MAVGRPTLAVSPQNGTKSDLRRSQIKNFPGGYVPTCHTPLAFALRALYAIGHMHAAADLGFFKILDPPLLLSSLVQSSGLGTRLTAEAPEIR